MQSTFPNDMDEHSPLLNTRHPSLELQMTGASARTSMSDQPRPPLPTASRLPTAGVSTTPTPPSSDRDPSGATAITTAVTTTNEHNDATDPTPKLPKARTSIPWGVPAGLPLRGTNDEMLVIFRRAVGINSDLSTATVFSNIEEGRLQAVGVYADVLRTRRRKALAYNFLNTLLWLGYFFQIVVAAALTGLGPDSAQHPEVITGLGVLNTVIAGFLALVKGQGLPERLRKDEMEFCHLQDWIEETEALLSVGVVGRDRKEVGLLVEMAFKRYNACKASEENNRPENYVPQTVEGFTSRPGNPGGVSNASAVSLTVPR